MGEPIEGAPRATHLCDATMTMQQCNDDDANDTRKWRRHSARRLLHPRADGVAKLARLLLCVVLHRHALEASEQACARDAVRMVCSRLRSPHPQRVVDSPAGHSEAQGNQTMQPLLAEDRLALVLLACHGPGVAVDAIIGHERGVWDGAVHRL